MMVISSNSIGLLCLKGSPENIPRKANCLFTLVNVCPFTTTVSVGRETTKLPDEPGNSFASMRNTGLPPNCSPHPEAIMPDLTMG